VEGKRAVVVSDNQAVVFKRTFTAELARTFVANKAEEISLLISEAEEVTSVTEKNKEEVSDISLALSREATNLEAVRKETVRPILDEKERVDEVFKSLQKRIKDALGNVDKALISHLRALEEEKKRTEALAKEKYGAEIVLEEPNKKFVSGSGSVSLKPKKIVTVKDPAALAKAIWKKEIPPRYAVFKTSMLERYLEDYDLDELPGCVVTKDYSPRHNQKRKNSGDTIDYDLDKDDE